MILSFSGRQSSHANSDVHDIARIRVGLNPRVLGEMCSSNHHKLNSKLLGFDRLLTFCIMETIMFPFQIDVELNSRKNKKKVLG